MGANSSRASRSRPSACHNRDSETAARSSSERARCRRATSSARRWDASAERTTAGATGSEAASKSWPRKRCRSRLPNSVPAFARRPLRPRREAPTSCAAPVSRHAGNQSNSQYGLASARRRWRPEQLTHGASAQCLPRDRLLCNHPAFEHSHCANERRPCASERISASGRARESSARRPVWRRRLPGRDQRRCYTGD